MAGRQPTSASSRRWALRLCVRITVWLADRGEAPFGWETFSAEVLEAEFPPPPRGWDVRKRHAYRWLADMISEGLIERPAPNVYLAGIAPRRLRRPGELGGE